MSAAKSSLTPAQQTAISTVPRVTAALSFIGSSWILGSILLDFYKDSNTNSSSLSSSNANNGGGNRRNNNRTTTTGGGRSSSSTTSNIRGRRNKSNLVGITLLAGMSLMDLLSSFSYIIGNVAFPEEKGGKGNQATCNAQGFFCNLQVGAALYSGFLSWYYCLYIRYHWQEHHIKKCYEKFVHIFVLVFVFCTGITSIALGLINPHWIRCYIAGPNSSIYFWLFFYAPIWASMLAGTLALFLVFLEVRKTEVKSRSYRRSWLQEPKEDQQQQEQPQEQQEDKANNNSSGFASTTTSAHNDPVVFVVSSSSSSSNNNNKTERMSSENNDDDDDDDVAVKFTTTSGGVEKKRRCSNSSSTSTFEVSNGNNNNNKNTKNNEHKNNDNDDDNKMKDQISLIISGIGETSLVSGNSTTSIRSRRRRSFSMADLPRTRRVAYQGIGYTIAFLLVYIFPTTSRIIQTLDKVPPYPIRLLAVTMVSSQGFWNWIVYFVLPKFYDWYDNQRLQQRRRRQQESSIEISRIPHHHNSSTLQSLISSDLPNKNPAPAPAPAPATAITQPAPDVVAVESLSKSDLSLCKSDCQVNEAILAEEGGAEEEVSPMNQDVTEESSPEPIIANPTS